MLWKVPLKQPDDKVEQQIIFLLVQQWMDRSVIITFNHTQVVWISVSSDQNELKEKFHPSQNTTSF